MELLDDFLVRAALAGVGVALATSALGCFVVWRRMAYFGEATAHAAMLGVALAFAAGLPLLPMVLVSSLAMAITVSGLSRRGHAMDTMLGVTAHASLAIGLVAVSLFADVRVDLMSFLFGDILAVSKTDLATIWLGGALIIGFLVWRWNALLTATLNPDLAWSTGLNPDRENMGLTIALAIVVAIAIKIVGVLLIAAMLVIPPAAARPLSSTPERMAIGAAIIGSLSAIGGLMVSFQYDTPTGPSMVCAATAIFFGTNIITALRR